MINLHHMNDAGLIFLLVVYHLVTFYILIRLTALYFRKRIEKQVEAFRSGFIARTAELENKLKEYERTHGTMV